MKKQTWKFAKKTLSAALAVLLVMAVAGCTGHQSVSSTASSGNTDSSGNWTGEVTKISVGMNTSSCATLLSKATWFTDYLKNKLGIELEMVDLSGNQKADAMLSSGEVPDLFRITLKDQVSSAISGKLVANWDQYKDKLPNIYTNQLYSKVLQYCHETFGGSDSGMYALQSTVGVTQNVNVCPNLRWDLYEKLGKPKISTLEDYLTVLKQMQDLNPKNANGESVYGLSIFPEWDGLTISPCTALSETYGRDWEYVSKLVGVPADNNGDIESILDDNSDYYRVLKFFYKANQMGILDPDSISQKWDTLSQKYTDGRVLFAIWPWAVEGYNTTAHTDTDSFTGYEPVLASDFKIISDPDTVTGVSDRFWLMSAKTQNPDAVLRFMNWFFSYEGQDLIFNGPQGAVWDTDSSGKRYVTEKGWDILNNDKELPGGGTLTDINTVFADGPITSQSINPDTNQTMSYSYWESTVEHKNSTKLAKDWSSNNNNAVDIFALGQKTNQIIKRSIAHAMMPVMPDDMTSTQKAIGEKIEPASWKMIYAKNDAEFDSLWTQLKSDCKTLGIEKVTDWIKTQFETCKTTAKKYE